MRTKFKTEKRVKKKTKRKEPFIYSLFVLLENKRRKLIANTETMTMNTRL